MEINGNIINPYSLPVPERRETQGYAGRQDAIDDSRERETPAASSTPSETPAAAPAGPDYQQLVQQSRVDQARQSRNGETYRINSDPYPVQRAMDAYREQIDEGRRFMGGIELMPRVDAYV